MRKFLFIAGGVLLAVIVLASGLWVWLFNTTGGRNYLIAKVESVASSPERIVKIGTLSGAPPQNLEITGMSVADTSGVWLDVEKATLVWSPFALLNRRVEIDQIVIERGTYHRAPISNNDATTASKPFRLPDSLPDVSIRSFELDNFTAHITDRQIRLDGAGALNMGGDDIAANLTLTSDGDRDTISIATEIHPQADQYFIDATVFGEADGLIADLSGLGESVLIEAKSDPEKSNTNINLTARIDSFGRVEGAIENIGTGDDIADLNLTGQLGDRFEVDELAGPITLVGQLMRREDGFALGIQSLTTAIGATTGAIAYYSDGESAQAITADLETELVPAYRSDLQKLVGSEIDLNARYAPGDTNAEIALSLETDLLKLSAPALTLSDSNVLSGDLAVSFAENDAAPVPLSFGGDGKTSFSFDPDGDTSLSNLIITMNNDAALSGDMTMSNSFSTIAADLGFDISPEFLSSLTSAVETNGRTTGNIRIAGPLDRFDINGSMETPVTQLSAQVSAPHRVTFSANDLPQLTSGSLRGVSLSNPNSKFEIVARPGAGSVINVPTIAVMNESYTLTGDAAFDREQGALSLDLRYDGAEGAEPWPGVFVNGVARISGGVSANDQAGNNLEFFADNVVASGTSLLNIRGAVTGAPNQTILDVKINETFRNDELFAENTAATLAINLEDPKVLTVTDLSTRVLGSRSQLRSPATLSFEDGISLSPVDIRYGPTGVINLTGKYTGDRISGAVDIRRVNLPQYDASITADLEFDTSQNTIASGALELFSLLDESETPLIASKFVWRDDTVTISNTDVDAYTRLNLTAPLTLIREPQFSLNAQGPISGSLLTDGSIEDYAIFLPDALQSLEGQMDVDIDISGTVDQPRLGGVAVLSDGRFTELTSGLSIVDIDLRAEGQSGRDAGKLTISGDARGAGDSDGKTISFDGALSAENNLTFQLTTTLKDAVFAAYPVTSVTANGAINVDGAGDAVAIAGNVDIAELNAEIITPESTGLVDIEVVAYNGTEEEIDSDVKTDALDLDLDLNVTANNRIFIRGRGLESEWGADASINDVRNEPIVLGRMSLDRGWLDFSGRRFDLTRGQITFDRLSANNPLVDIRAEFDTGENVTALIQVSGRATDPTIEFTSTPERPSEDVMALVLFGKPANELTPFESVQAAQALASLSGIGPFGGSGGLTGKLRQTVGLDLLNFDVDPETGGGSLTVGKYVTDDLFVSANQGASGDTGSVQIEFDVTNNITLESELEQTGDQTVSANWKIDF